MKNIISIASTTWRDKSSILFRSFTIWGLFVVHLDLWKWKECCECYGQQIWGELSSGGFISSLKLVLTLKISVWNKKTWTGCLSACKWLLSSVTPIRSSLISLNLCWRSNLFSEAIPQPGHLFSGLLSASPTLSDRFGLLWLLGKYITLIIIYLVDRVNWNTLYLYISTDLCIKHWKRTDPFPAIKARFDLKTPRMERENVL